MTTSDRQPSRRAQRHRTLPPEVLKVVASCRGDSPLTPAQCRWLEEIWWTTFEGLKLNVARAQRPVESESVFVRRIIEDLHDAENERRHWRQSIAEAAIYGAEQQRQAVDALDHMGGVIELVICELMSRAPGLHYGGDPHLEALRDMVFCLTSVEHPSPFAPRARNLGLKLNLRVARKIAYLCAKASAPNYRLCMSSLTKQTQPSTRAALARKLERRFNDQQKAATAANNPE